MYLFRQLNTPGIFPVVGGPSLTTYTIKSVAGDYATIALFEADTDNNLSGLGEIRGVIYDVDTTTNVVFAGATNTSESDFRHLTVDSANCHVGVWDAAKRNVQFSSLSTPAFDISEGYVKVSRLQIRNTHGTSPTTVIKVNDVPGAKIEQCIAWCGVIGSGDDNAGVYVGGANALSTRIRNSAIYACRNGVFAANVANTITVENCTTVACTFGIHAVNGVAANMVLKNHYSGGNVTSNYNEGGSNDTNFSFTTSMSSNAESTEIGLTNNIAYTTANFTNVTSGSEDIRLVSGSALIDQGTNYSGLFTVDIGGATRGATWDVGADEF